MVNEFVVIDFFADWCGTCKLVSSYVEKVADTYKDKVSIVKLNIENEDLKEIVSQHNVRSIPTILFIHKNEIKEYVNGAISQKTFTEKVEKLIQ